MKLLKGILAFLPLIIKISISRYSDHSIYNNNARCLTTTYRYPILRL